MKNSIPTLDLGLEPAEEGRSVGSFRPKIFFAALRAAVGRSVFTESETQKSHFLSRSVGDAELTFNFAPPKGGKASSGGASSGAKAKGGE